MPRTTSPTKSRATPPAPAPAPPSKQYEIHPKQPPHSGPGFLGSMVQGFGLGMGSSMGHRATDAIFGQSRSGEKKKEFPQEMGCVQKPVESLEDLEITYRKMRTLRDLLKSDRYPIRRLDYFFERFGSDSTDRTYRYLVEYVDESDIDSYINNIDSIIKIVEKL